MVRTVEWINGKIKLIDQTKLPQSIEFIETDNLDELAEAIKSLRVRGAPAIGVTAALGVAMEANKFNGTNTNDFIDHIEKVCDVLAATRPTAVNLFWALSKMRDILKDNSNDAVDDLKKKIIDLALEIANEDEAINRKIGEYGSSLIESGQTILTHCNAGSLATAYFGTALGVIFTASQQGKKIKVYADETRPLLQGARLTAWELLQENIPVTLITDSMAGYVMVKGKVNMVIVGADRIAANGDVANKIGTYSLAVMAFAHRIPFYVAAPISTIDFDTPDGSYIPIEERSKDEITQIQSVKIAPENVDVFNPAFDVTPNDLVSAIITERGIAEKSYIRSLLNMKNQT